MGEVFALPYAHVPDWPHDLADLRSAGFRLLALTPAPEAIRLDAVRADPADRLAVMLGAEGPGLTPAALEAADERVRIPMAADVDSLNIAAAAAVSFWALGHRS
jgi:tRNA G18 (ribose-2'-O)-methylase SpoU